MNLIAYLADARFGTFCSLFSSAFLAVTLVQKNPPSRSADAPLLIWYIDLTLAKALPRNLRTTGHPLQASAMAKLLRPVDCSIFMPLAAENLLLRGV